MYVCVHVCICTRGIIFVGCCCCCQVASVVSNSVRPHRRQPIRLPHPWDSPGKNTGVGCHFLLQCMKVKSESEVAQSCPILRDPMDCSLPGSSIHGIFQARVLEWGATLLQIRVTCILHLEKFTKLYSKKVFPICVSTKCYRCTCTPPPCPIHQHHWIFLVFGFYQCDKQNVSR